MKRLLPVVISVPPLTFDAAFALALKVEPENVISAAGPSVIKPTPIFESRLLVTVTYTNAPLDTA